MATNYYSDDSAIVLNVGTGVLANAPVLVGQIPGVAIDNADVNGNATVMTDGIWYLSVKGYVASTATALPVGSRVYISATGAVLDGTTANTYFGKLLDAVSSGATSSVRVLLGEY